MKQLQLNRRQFLALTLGAGLAWSVGQTTSGVDPATQHPLLTHLSTLLPHQQSARLIGQRYLQRYPQEAEIAYLLAALAVAGNRHDLRTLQQHITQQIHADFAAEKVVKVQGWLLSQTEARLCALATLV